MPASATERAAAVRAAFAAQGDWCARMGSPFTALICATVGERVDRDTPVGRRLLGWEGNPDGWADGLPLRLCGGLHALRRRGHAALAACYPPSLTPDPDLLWPVLRRCFVTDADFLIDWLRRPPQTNEVGRAAALMAGLLVVAAEFGRPIQLTELGASAGLNLMLDRYRYDLGGVAAGDPRSPLLLAPDWQGPPPPAARVAIVGRSGVDLTPVDPVRDRERLLAFVWADQQRRIDQLELALALAADDPMRIEAGDAADWLKAALPVAPEPGVARVVMHSVAFQYFSADTQARVTARIDSAGQQASADAPVAWLRFEKEPDDRKTTLRLLCCPNGEDRLLASCQPHGAAIHWF